MTMEYSSSLQIFITLCKTRLLNIKTKHQLNVFVVCSMLHTNILPNFYMPIGLELLLLPPICKSSYIFILDKITPCELWTGLKPDLSHFHIFLGQFFSHIRDEKRTKLDTDYFVYLCGL